MRGQVAKRYAVFGTTKKALNCSVVSACDAAQLKSGQTPQPSRQHHPKVQIRLAAGKHPHLLPGPNPRMHKCVHEQPCTPENRNRAIAANHIEANLRVVREMHGVSSNQVRPNSRFASNTITLPANRAQTATTTATSNGPGY